MMPGRVAYVYDGDTFLGSFDVRRQGPTTLVDVRYKGAAASANAGGLDPEIVARVLLGELVRDDLGHRPTTSPRRTAA
ncbi:MAG TPA: hypothetical protein VH414_17445 [Lichenihabitans sp.]|jgi:hypothetical protein|nr:hypothetical protein [Lichenihabitans sp.]